MKLTRNLAVSMREILDTGETNEGSGDILFFPLHPSVRHKIVSALQLDNG